MDVIKFTFSEMLSLLGVVQCVYILVYVSFRTIKIAHVFLTLLYFFTLALAFLLDFSKSSVSAFFPYFSLFQWLAWAYIVPLGALLIYQMAKITHLPPLKYWIVLLFPIIGVGISYGMSARILQCNISHFMCSEFNEWLSICALLSGGVSLLLILVKKDIFENIRLQPAGYERYWLILSLVMMSVLYLGTFAFVLVDQLDERTGLLRSLLGLGFCYLVSTSLFRIYPLSLVLADTKKKNEQVLAETDHVLLEEIKELLEVQKVYHEATYTRGDMARELGISEATLSRVMNVHFGKSFPQILNELRVQDAKRLLLETQENIKVIAEEVGFNSLPSFNRAFKDFEGRNPSDYRKFMVK